MLMDRPLLVLGTRPEAIKMAPVVRECRRRSDLSPVVCFTGQHREMVTQVADYFGVVPDVDLELMQPGQTLASLTSRCVEGLDGVVRDYSPTSIVAQGDTTTVMAASMIAFYQRLPFVHVEAGLRTGDIMSPWPEEFNRRVAGLVAGVHCAPTAEAARNLRNEGVPGAMVHVTGNTVVDALKWAVGRERERSDVWDEKYSFLGQGRVVLVTGHRRENLGGGMSRVCEAISRLAATFSDVSFVYPVHLNPGVQEPVREALGDCPNVYLVPPAAYPEFVWLMDRADVILTDSGGVQEEAPTLGKPVVLMRETTERPEAVEAGMVELVGTSVANIIRAVTGLLSDSSAWRGRRSGANPYGDGRSAERIAALIAERAWDVGGIGRVAA